MTPLQIVYWTRVILGIVAGVISTAVTIAFGERGLNTFLNGITVALLVYLTTYYLFKAKFSYKVDPKSKIMTMGIGIYFFTWLFSWVLIYTIFIGPL